MYMYVCEGRYNIGYVVKTASVTVLTLYMCVHF